MGLSASQARLLNLTARMHDIEYKAQNLEAQKLQMANESDQVYKEYEDALNKTKIQQKYINPDGSTAFEDVTAAKLKTAGYSFEVAVGTNAGMVYSTFEAAIAVLQAEKKINPGTFVDSTDAVTNFISEGYIVLVKLLDKDNKTATPTLPAKIDTLINGDAPNSYEVNVATDTGLQEVTDELELKKAEAKYEADMRKINNKDKKFDTDLAAMEQERNAIKTEIDTLKSVAKDNVDRTYKLFS